MATMASLALGGCVSSRMLDQSAGCVPAHAMPQITQGENGARTTTLSVLIYNVEGLPWPARKNRKPALRRIGDELRTMRQNGTAPDIVMLQEAFTPDARDVLVQAGYGDVVAGPGRKQHRVLESAQIDREFRKARKRSKGERFGRLLNSGLYIATDWPIETAVSQPFSRRACAGFDCLANKGAIAASVSVPGVPGRMALFTTHLNSQAAARVSLSRSRKAHGYQLEENALMIAAARDPADPLIIGGDFNMRGDAERFAAFVETQPYSVVHEFCVTQPETCRVKLSFDGDAPWLDTQDLQAFHNGTGVTVTPIAIEAMFDGDNGPRLSDHDGLLVTYQLRWRDEPAIRPIMPRICPTG